MYENYYHLIFYLKKILESRNAYKPHYSFLLHCRSAYGIGADQDLVREIRGIKTLGEFIEFADSFGPEEFPPADEFIKRIKHGDFIVYYDTFGSPKACEVVKKLNRHVIFDSIHKQKCGWLQIVSKQDELDTIFMKTYHYVDCLCRSRSERVSEVIDALPIIFNPEK